VIADTVMGMDNVLGIAGASHGNFLLVVTGLLISIPLVVWGSNIVLKLINRYPVVIYLGAGILAYTAGKMIVTEPLSKAFFEQHPIWTAIIYAIILVAVLGGGYLAKKRASKNIANDKNQLDQKHI